ncbi:MAG: pilus assembly protein TadG-related protein [Nitrospira sp.]|nr:pilus assembly protein TadG-related protein [Nitrospira sp.]MDH4369620.1 pilus assembly protein TadG-related protein [Nitrospira sp.]MDH5497139.1 pilus assembly protein TadG-related protein [Nitrospira sp.]MDH5726517.1 pilus assembly protein TadG-related protein [Nitrospira sp.]
MNNVDTKRLVDPLGNEHGAVAVMTALFLVVLLAMAAAAIDIGHALVAKNELQNTADAAALAGTRSLGLIYEGMTPAEQQAYTLTGGDQATIVSAVQTTALANSAAGVSIAVNASDIAIGTWNPTTRIHTPTVNQPKAVRVWARRDSSANGAISTFLAGVVGLTSISVSAVATADMTAVGQTAPGQLDVPFGISTYYFTQFGCGDTIKFYPNDGTPQACSAWNTFDQSPANANRLRAIIDGLRTGTYQSPGTAPGDTLNFTNGNVASVFPNLINLYNAKKDANGNWDVFVPVYDSPSCAANDNSGALPIVGYAEARITNVQGSPNHLISATVLCNIFEGNTTGGGPPFGPVLSTIPGLVE